MDASTLTLEIPRAVVADAIGKTIGDAVADLLKRELPERAQPAQVAQTIDDLPMIGSELDGGVYHGITIHENRPMRLVTLPGEFKGTWQECMKWAEKQGGALPSRLDGLVQVINAKGDFKPEAYWLADEYASDAGSAWCQTFDYGGQLTNHKDNELRARAVRRLTL